MLFYERTRLEHIAFVHSKVAIIVWGLMYYFYVPPPILELMGRLLVTASAGFAIIGSLIAIFALHLSASPSVVRRYQGIIIESAGLIIAMCGPLAYLLTNGYLIVYYDGDNISRHSYAALSYVVCAFILSRLIVIRRGFRKGA